MLRGPNSLLPFYRSAEGREKRCGPILFCPVVTKNEKEFFYTMKNKKTVIILAIVLVVLVAAAAIVMAVTSAKTEAGMKHFTLEIVYQDGTSKSFDLETEQEYLAGALVDAGIVPAYSEDGMYLTFDGVTADWNVDQGWWCITQDGNALNFGLNDLPVTEGIHYEATYTIGY